MVNQPVSINQPIKIESVIPAASQASHPPANQLAHIGNKYDDIVDFVRDTGALEDKGAGTQN